MKKNMVTEQQMELLRDAFEATQGTPDYLKYKCEWYFKSSKSGQWKFSIWGSPASFNKGYFKVIRGEIYIYSMDDEERFKLNEECKELLEITPETFNPPKKEKTLTKKEMAEIILQNSSCMGVSETRFYKNVNHQTKGWIERSYNYVMESKTAEEKKLNADFVMQWLR